MKGNRRPRTPQRSRRSALGLIGGVLAAPWIIGSAARAQAGWPIRPVRYINPYPPGGPTDTLSRLLCASLSELSGQQFVVENRGGDGGDFLPIAARETT